MPAKNGIPQNFVGVMDIPCKRNENSINNREFYRNKIEKSEGSEEIMEKIDNVLEIYSNEVNF